MASLFRSLAVLIMVAAGAASTCGQAPTAFEVATIKPSDPTIPRPVFNVSGRHIALRNQTVRMLLMYAYDVNDSRIEGAASWCGTEHYDIDGALETGSAESREQVQKIVQALLAERFGLKLHHEQRPMQAFVLRVADGGPKLRPAANPTAPPNAKGHAGDLTFTGMPMNGFAAALKYAAERPVVDETQLKGVYDFTIRWTPDGSQTADPAAPPPLSTALREQLGLDLKAERRPVDVVVVDAVQRPSAN